MQEDEKRQTVCGTTIYLAPEIIKEEGHDEKVDIWCIGVLLFELITGNTVLEAVQGQFNQVPDAPVVDNTVTQPTLEDPNVNTILSVDEAHVLLSAKNTLGAEFLAQVQRRARKYNTGTIIITQQPTDFASPNIITQGKAIFDNASYYLVMGLKKQAVEDLALLIDLNENEKESIKRYSQGEALFVCGSRRMRIRVIVTQEELDSFGSGGGL